MGTEKTSKSKRPFRAPCRPVLVQTATPKGDQLVCTFTARRTTGTDAKNLTVVADKETKTFQCESPEHAKILAEHAKKLHARKNKRGLIRSLEKLSEGVAYADGTKDTGLSILQKARARAERKHVARQKVKEENQKRRRADEERRLRSEKHSVAR